MKTLGDEPTDPFCGEHFALQELDNAAIKMGSVNKTKTTVSQFLE
jgi:hypothetical protein